MVSLLSVGACSKGGGVDYCKNHNSFHADHLDALAKLTINLSDGGELEGSVSMPLAVFANMAESEVDDLFNDAENLFTLQAERSCTVSVVGLDRGATNIGARFKASCGGDNKLGRVAVSMFEHFRNLEEVETLVTTSATSKRFAISRQCDSPIFRLD